MAAVLSRNRSDITKLTFFMDECKSMRIPIKGPDVNESFNDFGVNKEGAIRYGLAAIKGVGDNVVASIIAARKEGGPFQNIYDFVERVPSQAINRKVMESLALAGAFDCFPEAKREDYFEKNSRDESLADQLMRYGALYQKAQSDQTASLFGDMDAELNTAGRPTIRPAQRWVDSEKLQHEKDLVGMFLSGNPLDPFYMELNFGMQTIKQRNEMEPEEGKEVVFGGMVTKFESRPAKSGGFFGIMSVEDYSGSTEFRLFKQKYVDFAKYGVPGTPIVVNARFERRYNGEITLEIQRIRLLSDIKGQLLGGVNLTLTPTEITPTLTDILKECLNRKPEEGTSFGHFNVNLADPASGRLVKLTSSHRVPLDRELAKTLDQLDVAYTFERN